MLNFRAQKKFVPHQFIAFAFVFRGIDAFLNASEGPTPDILKIQGVVEIVKNPEIAFLVLLVHKKVDVVAEDDVRNFRNFSKAVWVPLVGGLVGVDAHLGQVSDIAVCGSDAIARKNARFNEIA
jgi:hypothetical protein